MIGRAQRQAGRQAGRVRGAVQVGGAPWQPPFPHKRHAPRLQQLAARQLWERGQLYMKPFSLGERVVGWVSAKEKNKKTDPRRYGRFFVFLLFYLVRALCLFIYLVWPYRAEQAFFALLCFACHVVCCVGRIGIGVGVCDPGPVVRVLPSPPARCDAIGVRCI